MLDKVANIEKVEEDLNRFIARRAKGAETGRDRANAEAAYYRARESRRNHNARLVHARAWATFYGGQALQHHDLAAQAAEKCDQALDLVRELEATNHRGGTA